VCSEELLVRSHLESAKRLGRAMVTKLVSATVDCFVDSVDGVPLTARLTELFIDCVYRVASPYNSSFPFSRALRATYFTLLLFEL